MRVLTKTYAWLRRWDAVRRDFCAAKHRLLCSPDFTHEEKTLLEKVSLEIHHGDTMYAAGNAFHYLSVGLSATHCIREALCRAPAQYTVGSLLDFPCGYGRVLRFLRAMFPNAEITAAEIDRTALDFCRRHFAVATCLSKTSLSDLMLPQRFDLIWCGSLFTHIDEETSGNLLRFFHEHLSDRGLCVFTTHGWRSIEWIEGKKFTYGLSEDAQQKVIREFQSKGYGYADYANQSGYGVSAVTHQRICELARGVRGWDETLFLEQGWDNHQDVYAFAMQPPKRGLGPTP
jgi:SAM-dependent methyltransferase